MYGELYMEKHKWQAKKLDFLANIKDLITDDMESAYVEYDV